MRPICYTLLLYMPAAHRSSSIGEFEQLVLAALLRLGNGAFGAAIHREIVARTGRAIAPARST